MFETYNKRKGKFITADDIINEFCERVLTEITAKGIYENHRIIIESAPLKDALNGIKNDMLNDFHA